MLIGREAEVARLERLLDGAATGASGTLLIGGPAGIGKTALTGAVLRRAGERGILALHARGVEAEADVPFAGLHELLAPVLDVRGDLSDHHRRTLEVALGLRPGTAPAPFAVAVGLLALIAAAAERRGTVLIVVDDAQWFDAGSLEALLFAARRLQAERVAIVVAARPEPDRGLADRGLEQLLLSGLEDDDARAVVRAVAGAPPSEAALRRIVDRARGFPLALVELVRSLDAAGAEGEEADAALPQRPSEVVERAFGRQLAGLAPAVRGALLVAAADERAGLAEVRAAVAALGLPADALEVAERLRLVELELDRIHFRHPLLRSVAYHGATAADRVAAHRALATTMPPLRGVWHRAAAADGPDEQIAAGLEAAGRAARGRGDLDTAVRAYRRAAVLTPSEHAAGPRWLAAAELAMAAGALPESREIAERALATGPDDPALRVDLERIRATVLGRMGELDAGIQPLLEHADRIAAADPPRAALLLLGAGPAYWFTGRLDRFGTVVDRAATLAEDDPTVAALAGLLRSMVLVNLGRVPEAEATLRRHQHVLDRDDLPDPGYELLASPAHVSVWTGRLDRAAALIDRQLATARRQGAPAALVYPLTVKGQLDLRRGRTLSALATGAEAVELGRDTRQAVLEGLAAAVLAQTEAALGRERACREHAATALEIAGRTGAVATATLADAALGTLELGAGRVEAALAALERCRQQTDRAGLREPNVVRWQGDWIEALVRLDRIAEAETGLRELEARLAVSPTGWTAATVLRARGLLDPGESGERELERAAEQLEAIGDTLEAARVRLALGGRRRRAGRRRLAREPLHAALSVFARSGATTLAVRADEEIRASGGPRTPRSGGPIDELTPYELRVALLVADGRTNPEVAAELFIARKTVEHHLSQIYRKLGLRSRTELARELAGVARD